MTSAPSAFRIGPTGVVVAPSSRHVRDARAVSSNAARHKKKGRRRALTARRRPPVVGSALLRRQKTILAGDRRQERPGVLRAYDTGRPGEPMTSLGYSPTAACPWGTEVAARRSSE